MSNTEKPSTALDPQVLNRVDAAVKKSAGFMKKFCQRSSDLIETQTSMGQLFVDQGIQTDDEGTFFCLISLHSQ